eukprot:TRINITY_DN12058_c0_g2_i4.p2 TRINITY_DN12058_c0_g2~~TRINITY_DN12058_c0_g2_i4.p2  ORF type:complete len:248 (+),score=43.71 TRINITY_DN12058_c0_g2_i4:188-931(+)
MKLKNTVGLVVGAAIAASSMSAMAGKAGSVEVEAFADRYFTDSMYGLNDGTLVGGNIGYFVSENVLLNMGLGKYKNLEVDGTNEDVDGKLAQVEAVYHFGTGNVLPYISAGLAHQELKADSDNTDDRTTMAMAGVGIKNYLNENFFVKAGVDALYGFDHGNTEWQAGVGLGINFGGKSEPVAEPAPAPAPMPEPTPAPEMQSVRVELDVLFDFDKDTIRPEYRQEKKRKRKLYIKQTHNLTENNKKY